jgi:hypothetical protein
MLLFGANLQNNFSCSLFWPIKLNVLSTVASETYNAISFEARFVAIKLPLSGLHPSRLSISMFSSAVEGGEKHSTGAQYSAFNLLLN